MQEFKESSDDTFIYQLSYQPFFVGWSSKEMALLPYNLSSDIVNLDCSGSMVTSVPWDSDKIVYNYNLVVKAQDKPPVAIAELLSNNHSQDSIFFWLKNTQSKFQEISNSEVWPFKGIITDMSWAMSNAVLQAICNMSLQDYLEACLACKETGHVPFIVLAWCYAHFLHAISKKVKKWIPLQSKKYSPARCFMRMTMAHIARTTELDDALQVFKNFVKVVSSPFISEEVVSALQCLSNSFGGNCVFTEDEAEKMLLNLEENPDRQAIEIPKEDLVYYKWKVTYKDSPFYKKFAAVAEQVEVESQEQTAAAPELGKQNRSEGVNPYYIPKAVKYLLRYYFPYYPFWSKYLQCLVKNGENPWTNSDIELKFRLTKLETLGGKLHLIAPRYLLKATEDSKRRLLEYKFNANFKRIGRKKRKQDDKSVDDPSSMVKVAKETWKKKRKNERPPGGLHSEAATGNYAHKINKKALELQESLQKSTSFNSAEDTSSGVGVGEEQSYADQQQEVPIANIMTAFETSNEVPEAICTEGNQRYIVWEHIEGDIYKTTLDNGNCIYSEKSIVLSLAGAKECLLSSPETDCVSMNSSCILVPVALTSEILLNIADEPSVKEVNMDQDNSPGLCPQPICDEPQEPVYLAKNCSDQYDPVTPPELPMHFSKLPSKFTGPILENTSFGADFLSIAPNEELTATELSGFPGEILLNTADEPSAKEVNMDQDNSPRLCPQPICDKPQEPVYLEKNCSENFNPKIIQKLPLEFPDIPVKFSGKILKDTIYDTDLQSILPKIELTQTVVDCFVNVMKFKAAINGAAVYTLPGHLLVSISQGLPIAESYHNHESLYKDLWLVPCQVNNNHWILFAICMRRKYILLLDSLNKSLKLTDQTEECLQILFYLLSKVYERFCNSSMLRKEWTVHAPYDIAVQKNGYDCGIFVCLWAHAFCDRGNFTPSRTSPVSHRHRNWVAEVLLQNSNKLQNRAFEVIGDLAPEQVKEHQRLVAEGSLIIKKPWKDIKLPRVKFTSPDQRSTAAFMASFLDELWEASQTRCGAALSCKLQRVEGADMILCEICREWYHPLCIKDEGGNEIKRKGDSHYWCPIHRPKSSSEGTAASKCGRRKTRLPSRLLL